jgi:hypothetical protein
MSLSGIKITAPKFSNASGAISAKVGMTADSSQSVAQAHGGHGGGFGGWAPWGYGYGRWGYPGPATYPRSYGPAFGTGRYAPGISDYWQ